jgi:hypothetical protein
MDVEATKGVVGGLSMLLAPLLLLVGFAIHPPEPRSGAEAVEVIVDDPGRWNAAHIAFSFGMALSIPAVGGLVRLLGNRGAWFSIIGGLLAAVGVVFFGVFLGVELAMSAMVSAQIERYGGLELGMQALVDLEGALPVVLLGLSLNLGLIVLATGLFVTRAVPRWRSVAIAGASLVLVGGLFSNQIGAVGAAVLLVGLGAIGLQVLKLVR